MLMLLDNNFSDDRDHMLEVCGLLKAHPKVRGWSALVTQNVLHDRALIRHLAASKCIGLFVGLESLDPALLRRHKKTQNLSRRFDVVSDIAYAESQGISITYGYLFDPRHQPSTEMERQIRAIAQNPLLPMPVYISLIAPLAGTEIFWADLKSRELAPNLRLRDLDGETIAYSKLADRPEAIADFVEKIFGAHGRSSSRLRFLPRPRVELRTLGRSIRSAGMSPPRQTCTASCGRVKRRRGRARIWLVPTRSIRNISSDRSSCPTKIERLISIRST